MKLSHKKYLILFVLCISFIQFGCTGIYDAIVNLQRLQFKLGSVNNMRLANVALSNITSISNLSIIDAANLVAAFSRGELPASFTLNVIAKNPNDGTGGTKNTSAVIKRLDWRMLIDSKETISGNIGNISVPGTGQQTTIPITIGLDLIDFFSNMGYESLVNLALALGGRNGSSSRITLKARPTVDTPLGSITYPGEIDIVDREFRSQ
jgi:hypothetical protein